MKWVATLFAVSVLASGAMAAELRTPESFSGIKDKDQRAAAIFTEAGKVLLESALRELPPGGQPPDARQ